MQETKLEDKYGKKFVEEFKKDLADFEKEGKTAESVVTEELLSEMEVEKGKNAKELKEARERIAKLEKRISAQFSHSSQCKLSSTNRINQAIFFGVVRIEHAPGNPKQK